MRYAARKDASQPKIVQELRDAGVFVYVMDTPCDLLCAYRGTWYPVECKELGGKLTPAQRKFINDAPAPVHVIRSASEFLRLIGLESWPSTYDAGRN